MSENAKILKTAAIGALTASEEDLKLINRFTLEPLEADDVFLFKLSVCSNAQDTDRDYEPFMLRAVKELSEHLEGKTIILDHDPSAKNQIARIYATQLINYNEKTEADEPLTSLEAHCYMVKTDRNADLIAEIKAGIKKEVSVGFSTSEMKCSICGKRFVTCAHHKGQIYDGKVCRAQIKDCIDAYEVSFVAVPCQVNAGTVKSANVDKNNNSEDELLVRTRIRIYNYFKEAE
ncbi:hypothetical protein [Ruminococcus sp.]|uniref:hypothetical protein n=1 Tax=Ruminococcus sp. TaxID=41978 RepID=UPI00386BCC97